MEKRYFICVDAAGNNNKFYNMIPIDNYTWRAEWGRYGSSPQTKVYPMRDWDKKANEKYRKGYQDVTDLHRAQVETPSVSNAEIKDGKVASLVKRLRLWGERRVAETYLAKIGEVTQAMVDKAQMILSHMQTIRDSVDAFNYWMEELATTIPRRMGKVEDFMAKTTADFSRILSREQEILDNMAAQVKARTAMHPTAKDAEESKTILEALGITATAVEDVGELKKLKQMLGKQHANNLLEAYRVTNAKTEAAYQRWKTANGAEEHLRFHGSKRENFWSIWTLGLLISKAVYGMFGKGIYFADQADKSLGYANGGRWDRGDRTEERILGIFKVAYKNPLHLDSAKTCLDARIMKYDYDGKYDAVFAHEGSSLRRNEFIVYDERQVTIAYILVMKG